MRRRRAACSPAPWLFLRRRQSARSNRTPQRRAWEHCRADVTDNRTAPSLTASINKFLGRGVFPTAPPLERQKLRTAPVSECQPTTLLERAGHEGQAKQRSFPGHQVAGEKNCPTKSYLCCRAKSEQVVFRAFDLRLQSHRFWRILLKKAKVERLRKSRQGQFLIVSAAASRCRAGTKACDRFCANRCSPSRCRARDAPGGLKNFVRQPEETFSTVRPMLSKNALA